MARSRRTRVLVVDDSAYNRRTLAGFLDQEPDIEVVGKACDGEEALEIALQERPHVITLDLEMPRMGGFAFLRILMAKRPTPVIVISRHSQAENVFRALDLGALDFVAKPTQHISPEIKQITEEVVSKVRLARSLKRDSVVPRTLTTELARRPRSVAPVVDDVKSHSTRVPREEAVRVVAIAASTGGPTALSRILGDLPGDLDLAVVIVQHMPPRFTTTFAERLDRQCRIRVREAAGMEPLEKGTAYFAPGNACLEIVRTDEGLKAVVVPPNGTERYVPSADRLFSSVAAAVGPDAMGVVLTGMGNDGSRGIKDLAAMGAKIVAEDDSTAIVAGMPQAAVSTGVVKIVAPLDHLSDIISSFAKK